MRYEDFTLQLTNASEAREGNVRLLAFHLQVPSAAGLATITEPIPSRCDLAKLRCISDADPTQPATQTKLLEVGSALGHSLFPGIVLAKVREALVRLRSRRQGLRLRLVYEALHWVPWEYAILPPERGEATATDFLALMPDVSIVRDQACQRPEETINAGPPFRILGAAAHPRLAEQINVVQERLLLEAALRDARGVELMWVNGGSRPAPSADLRHAQMFHFAGHGAFELVAKTLGSMRDVVVASDAPGQPE